MPVPALAPFTPWLFSAGIGWMYYRRIRRQFGRQAYQPKRMIFRLVLLGLVSVGLAVAVFALPHVALAALAGAAIGVGLGWLSLRHTHVGRVDGVRMYTPNPWIGGTLSVLLIGRLAWRWYSGAFSFGAQQAGQQASPLTFAFLAALVAYYLINGIGLIVRMRALESAPAGDGPGPG